MGNQIKRFVIFSGGEIYDYSVISINKGDTVICADCGLNHALRIGINPDVIIGDFDSYSDSISRQSKIIRCSPEKDDTDTLMCVKYAVAHGADRIDIYGGLSGRLDHTFANIQTLKYCAERNIPAVINDGFNRVLVQHSCICEYPADDQCYFSVFALSDMVFLSSMSGVKYPLENYRLISGFPIGVSNEIISDKAVLDISDGYALIIFSKK